MKFLTRAECGLRPPKYRNAMSSYRNGVFTHHGASPNYPPDPIGTWRGYQNWHMDAMGWSDIGYSWGVTHEGQILEGRGWGISGGHTQGYNSTSHAACYIGTSDTAPVPDVALRALRTVHDEHDRLFGASPHRGHLEVNQTSCPGTGLQPWMDAGMPVSGPGIPTPPDPTEEETMRIIYAKKPGGGWEPNAIWNGGGTRERMEDPGLVALFGANWADLPIRVEVDHAWYMGLRPVASDNVWA